MRNLNTKTIIRISVTVVMVVLMIILTISIANRNNKHTEQSAAAEITAPEAALPSEEAVMPGGAPSSAVNEAPAAPAPVIEDGLTEAAPTVSVDEQTDSPPDGQPAEQEEDNRDTQTEQQPDAASDSIYTNTNYNTPADGSKIAYITIDDGPSRAITPGILDILAQEGIHATFFVLPHDGVRDLYRREIDEGHEIGNHSYSHVYSRLYNADDLDTFRDDVNTARSFMWENFGYWTTTFRFPGGMMGRRSSIVEPRQAILEEMEYRYFDWNIDTGDANSNVRDKSAASLTNNVLNNTRDRDRIIVLMHDTGDKATTLEALPMIIAGLREQGYVFDVLRNYDTPQPGNATPTSLSD